jgi:heat shock protein HtpX
MWELIKSNKRKSILLFIAMAMCLMLLGYLIGAAFFPPNGGVFGLFIAIAVWLVMSLTGIFAGDAIFLGIARAKPVTHDIHPQLFNVTEEMKIAAGLPVMPKLYIMNEFAPNAFATGVKMKKSSIVVTSGLLARLNRDELQGVVAHEMAHILNRDVQFVGLAGVLLGSITLISHLFLRSMFYSSFSSRRYSSRSSGGGGQAQVIFLIISVVFAIVAPLLARLLYFAISRKREYLADATAVRLTRYPEGLASALEKIVNSKKDLVVANKITAPMYIANPIKKKGMRLSDLSSTHPPASERIEILRAMMHGVNYKAYQQAYAMTRKDGKSIIPDSGLQESKAITMRKPQSQPKAPASPKDVLRQIGDIARAANGFAFIGCACGVKIKVPANFKKTEIDCPRCHRHISMPVAEMAALGTVLSHAGASKKAQNEPDQKPSGQPQTYNRKTSGWESFRCHHCHHTLQISPLFSGSHMECSECKSKIEIKAAA